MFLISYCLDPWLCHVWNKKMAVSGRNDLWTAFKDGNEDSKLAWISFIHSSTVPPKALFTGWELSPLQIGHIWKAHLGIYRVFSQSSSEHLDRPWGSNRTESHASAVYLVQCDQKSLRHSQIAEAQYSNQQDDQPSCSCLLTPHPKMYLTDGWLPYRDGYTCLPELHIGTCATEYAEHFRASLLQGPAVAYGMQIWKGDSKKETFHFISADKDSPWWFSLLILYPMPSPRCGDFGTTNREMSTYKAKHYLKPKCLPESCFALTLRKWNGWLVFYFKKILYTFAKVFNEWQLVFALMEDQWQVFVSWISALIFWILRLKSCFTKLLCPATQGSGKGRQCVWGGVENYYI